MTVRSCPSKSVSVLLLALTVALVLPSPSRAASGPEELAWFIGKWDVEILSVAGNVIGRAETRAKYAAHRTMIMDEYTEFDARGQVAYRGVSLRTFVPSTGRWAVHWGVANIPGYTYIDAVWMDGELHGDGRGFDAGGEFVEKYRYFDITGRSYAFTMSRSYDGGKTWRQLANLRAKKRGKKKT